MLNQVVYLSAIWLLLAFFLALLFGTCVRWGNFVVSVLYLTVVIGVGDIIALFLIGEPTSIAVSSAVIFWIGIFLILLLPNWNALGQSVFVFSLFATGGSTSFTHSWSLRSALYRRSLSSFRFFSFCSNFVLSRSR